MMLALLIIVWLALGLAALYCVEPLPMVDHPGLLSLLIVLLGGFSLLLVGVVTGVGLALGWYDHKEDL